MVLLIFNEHHTGFSIFSPASRQQRQENFENYWQFTQQHRGELFEDDRDLAKKRDRLRHFQDAGEIGTKHHRHYSLNLSRWTLNAQRVGLALEMPVNRNSNPLNTIYIQL